MNDADIQKYQQALVEQLKKANIFKTPLVEEAFLKVPRHLFLPGEPLDKVYSDVAIVVKRGDEGQWTSSSSMPAIMAIMLEQLDLKPGQRVLEIGTGTGFNASLIASIVGPSGKVVTVDIQPDLVEYARERLDLAGYDWVQTLVGDGGYGYPDGAPYDRIILTVGSDVITPAWREQLTPGGILVLPFAIVGPQLSVAFEKRGGELVSIDSKPCVFMPIQGAFTPAQPVQTQLGPDSRLCMFSEKGKELPVGADTIFTWLSQEGKDRATGVTVTRYELEWGLSSWVGIQESQANQQTGLGATLCAKGDLADQNLIPSLAGVGGEWKAMYSGVIIESDGMAAMMRPPGQIAPLMDIMHPDDNTPFELYVRNFGLGTNAGQCLLEYIQNWDQAGKPTSLSWKIRAIPVETEYHPTDGEFLVNKTFTKLIISYQYREQRANTAPLRGISDVKLTVESLRVFTCACGKVQAGSFCGSSLVPSKWRCLVPGERRDAAQSRPPVPDKGYPTRRTPSGRVAPQRGSNTSQTHTVGHLHAMTRPS
jgi:protein-L-isoaspartate(D-aspartate) O-methyltransferase